VVENVQRIPLQRIGDCVVASLQGDTDEATLHRFRADLLAFLGSDVASGVLLDLSGVEVMDTAEFSLLEQILAMVKVMGSRPVIAGLRPGVVSALVDLGVDGRALETALNIDDALERLGESARPTRPPK
jgi:rsbT antagonist protein RsbS